MTRQSKDVDSDSFDLLLDTICNVFGGIILLTILVVLHTQMASGRMSHADPQDRSLAIEKRQLQLDISALDKELADLVERRDALATRYASAVTPVRGKLLARWEQFVTALETGKHQAAETAASLAQAHKAIADMKKRRELVDRELVETTDLLRAKEREFEKAQSLARSSAAKPPIGVRPPHRRGRSVGTPNYYVIKGSRAYALGRVRWTGDPFVSEDCRVEPIAEGDSPAIRVRPIEGAGDPIDAKAGPADSLRRSIRAKRPKSSFFVFFVWDSSESYRSFQAFKKAVLALGFKYRAGPKLPEEGDSIILVPVPYLETE